jgi:DnaD/phage-associated family protein
MPAPSHSFTGFDSDDGAQVPLPSTFFAELLPVIDNLAELKVTLYALWALADRPTEVLTRSTLADQPRLMAGLAGSGLSAAEALDDALERAVQRGSLLQSQTETGEACFLLNSQAGRRALAGGQGRIGEGAPLEAARPNAFILYEHNIGPLTPMLAESLAEAVRTYPAGWIEQAIRIAVENNVRKWRYIEAILEEWKTQGRNEREDRAGAEEARQRYHESFRRHFGG